MRAGGWSALLIGALLMPAAASGEGRKTPYWASIVQPEARMRVGPSTDYPASWIYRRRDLPVKVLVVYKNWRKVEDPEGATGWMHVSQLSAAPTAIVTGGTAAIRQSADAAAPTLYRAEAGVVGRVSDCGQGWCMIDVHGQRGYVEATRLWGATE